MTLEQLRRLYAEKINGAKALSALAKDGVLTQEQLTQIDGLLAEADQVKAQIETLERVAAGEKFISEPLPTKAAHLGMGDVQVVKDEGDQPFPNQGEFYKAVRLVRTNGIEDPRLRPLRVNADFKATGMSEGVAADGGYLVNKQYAASWIERMYNIGTILGRVARDPVSGNTMTYHGIDETSRVNGSRMGGITGYWAAEAATLASSKPKFRDVELKLNKVYALVYATDEQLEDTPNLESWINRRVPEELRFKAEDAIYEGTGAGQPLGIMNSPALVSILRLDANKIQLADILNMWSRRWAASNNYVWLINQDVIPQLMQLGTTYQLLYMPPGGLSSVPYGTLFGRPVLEVEYASTLGTTGDIMLADLGEYQTIDKGNVNAASSMHVAFTTDEMAYRFTMRLDGAPLWHSALTPFKGSNTQSPFVVLTSASA